VNATGERGGRRRGLRWGIAAAVLALIATAAAVAVAGGFDGGGGGGPGGSGSATTLATVTRRSLSETTQFNGTLGYAGSYTVVGQAHGTVTRLPAPGRIVRNGQVLYRVDGAPVILLYGPTPAYRTLAEPDANGADVVQLNHDLVALGYLSSAAVDSAWDVFNSATRAGVERLQRHLGVEQTGLLALGDVVFLPGAARVTTLQAILGAPAAGAVLQATSTMRTVSVALDPDLQSQVGAGDRVTITLPDGRTTPGRVTSVGTVATAPPAGSAATGGPGGSDSGPTVPVQIRLTHPRATGSLDQALVEVAITDRTVRDVLAVPVSALLARSSRRYAVEVVTADGAHRLVPVALGLFDDAAGLVQASGPGLAAGQRVVVPGE
jgi:Putative peptidoglycan binding domain